MFVTDFLVTHFAELLDVTFTAQMEEELDQISDGERPWLESLRKYYAVLEKYLKAGGEAEDLKRTGIPVDEKCPKCGKDMVIKSGRFGRFKACSGYPECTHKETLVKKETKPLDEKCPQCGAPLVIKFGRFGSFIACSSYPKCKYIQKDKVDTGIACPEGLRRDHRPPEDAPGEIFLRLQPLPEVQVRDLGRAGGQALPVVRAGVRPEEELRQGRSLPLLPEREMHVQGDRPEGEDLGEGPRRGPPPRRPMRKAIDEFLAHLRHERNASPHTVAAYGRDLGQLLAYLEETRADWKTADNVVLRGFLARLYEGRRKKTSIGRKLAAIRSFYDYAVRRKWIDDEPRPGPGHAPSREAGALVPVRGRDGPLPGPALLRPSLSTSGTGPCSSSFTPRGSGSASSWPSISRTWASPSVWSG